MDAIELRGRLMMVMGRISSNRGSLVYASRISSREACVYQRRMVQRRCVILDYCKKSALSHRQTRPESEFPDASSLSTSSRDASFSDASSVDFVHPIAFQTTDIPLSSLVTSSCDDEQPGHELECWDRQTGGHHLYGE